MSPKCSQYVRPLYNKPPNKTDGDTVVLSPDHAERVARFCGEICLCKTDMKRYELCVRLRNEFLMEYTGVPLLAATCGHYRCWEEIDGYGASMAPRKYLRRLIFLAKTKDSFPRRFGRKPQLKPNSFSRWFGSTRPARLPVPHFYLRQRSIQRVSQRCRMENPLPGNYPQSICTAG